MLWSIDELLIFLLTTAAFLGVVELGFRLGYRHRARSDEAGKSHVGALQGALLGLLGLLLGFTFAMAVSRFDARKALVLDEANAIGTTALRAQLLPAAERQEAAALLREYVQARLDFYDAGADRARLDAANAAAARLQQRLWALAVAAAAQDPRSVPTGLFLQALNETIDFGEKRQTALENHVPETVIYLLVAVALGALGFIAYGSGLGGRRRYGSTVLFGLLIALVLTVILDLDRPRRGLIRVSQQSMVRLKAALDQEAPPALPTPP